MAAVSPNPSPLMERKSSNVSPSPSPLMARKATNQSSPLAQRQGNQSSGKSSPLKGRKSTSKIAPVTPPLRKAKDASVQKGDPTEEELADQNLLSKVAQGAIEEVQKMLQAGQQANIADDRGTTPFHLVAKLEDELGAKLVRVLLDHGGYPDFSDSYGVRPIAIAIQGNRLKVARTLIAAGTSLTAVNPKTGQTLLHDCSWAGHPEMGQLLLATGAFDKLLEVTNLSGQTALHLAAFRAPKSFVSMLIDAGADVDAKEATTQRISSTASELASKMGKPESAQLLKEMSVSLQAVRFAAKMKSKPAEKAKSSSPRRWR